MVAVLLPSGRKPEESPDDLFPDIDSFHTYQGIIDYDGDGNLGYIVAEFEDSVFPDDNQFTIGDPLAGPDDGSYNNGPLKYGSSFTFFLRSYPLLDDTVSIGLLFVFHTPLLFL